MRDLASRERAEPTHRSEVPSAAEPVERPPQVIARAAATGPVDTSGASRGFASAVGAGTLVARAAEGPSSPLPAPTREKFEGSLGTSLSDVRVHTDGSADTAARSVNAHAFAQGKDIFFRSGQYDPGSSSGERLLAHEVAHTAQGLAPASVHGKLEVTAPGDACEADADRAADAMVAGQPANVGSFGGGGIVARWRGMDGGVDVAEPTSDVAPPSSDSASSTGTESAPPVLLAPPGPHSREREPRNWLAEAGAEAATYGDDSLLLRAATCEIGEPTEEIAHDSGLSGGWSALQQIARSSSALWASVLGDLMAYSRLPADFEIPGGGGARMHDVMSGHDEVAPVSDEARHRAFTSPAVQGAGHGVRAAESSLAAAVDEAHAAADELHSADADLIVVLRTADAHQAAARGHEAEGRRDAATRGRAEELERIQNTIRVIELGVAVLAGGALGASGLAAEAPAAATAMTRFGRGAGATAMGSVAGIGANSIHDMAIGWVAEQFLDGQWDRRIARANEDIAAAARAVQRNADAADQAAIQSRQARQQAASARLDAASSRIRAARAAHRQALMELAAASGTAVGGSEGRRVQGAVAALVPVQTRLARIAQLEQAIEVPAYTTSTGFAFAELAGGDTVGPTHVSEQFLDVIAHLIYVAQRFLPRERTIWEHRQVALQQLINSMSSVDGDVGAP